MQGPSLGLIPDETTVNGYVVRFDGRTVTDGNTTFTYTVHGTGVDPSLSHFTVELPPCAPAVLAYSPTGSANINTNPQTGIYGIEWHLSVAKDDLVGRTYSVTFAGEVPLGIVRCEVMTENGERGVADVFGPCGGFRVSGTVFVDADNDGLQAPSEGGIGNVTVTISDGAAAQDVVTDAAGDYTFVVGAGSYTVSVNSSTPAADFNEDLFATFTVVTPTSLVVTVGPDALNTDFAFEPRSDKVIADLDAGILLTDGKPVRFWIRQLRSAQNSGGNATYTATQVLSFLEQVEGLGILTPFQFGTGTEVAEALAILGDNRKDEVVALKRELLASELNFVSGNGLVGQEDLHEILIIWGEELVAQNSLPAGPMAQAGGTGGSTETGSATSMFQFMNGSTGGGGTEE